MSTIETDTGQQTALDLDQSENLAENQSDFEILKGSEKAKSKSGLLATLFWMVVTVAAFALGWWVANKRSHQEDRIQLPPSTTVARSDAMLVTVAPVQQQKVTRSIEAVGSLHGYEEVTLSANVDGRVIKVHHDLASQVKPGELLLELDPTDKQLAVQQADRNVQAELAKWGFKKVPAESEDLSKLPTVNIAKLKYELAKSSYERLRTLRASNSVAIEDLEKSNSDALVAESEWKHQSLMAQSAAATARLRQAELEIAQRKLEDCKILAPIPTQVANSSDQFYSVSERMVSEGTLLRPGTEVLRLVLGRTLKLRLSVPESVGSRVAVGQPVEVHGSTTDQTLSGTVVRIGPSIDRSTRTFLVEAEVPNDQGLLKAGGFAKAKIETTSGATATTIPLSGLYAFAGIYKIFLLENGVAREIKVTLGEQTREWIEIATPSLPDGAIVLTSGQRLLSDGMAVEVRSEATNEESQPPKSDISSRQTGTKE